jgi:hypothetical protein
MDTQVQSQVTSADIRGGRSDTGDSFSDHHFTISPYLSITAP